MVNKMKDRLEILCFESNLEKRTRTKPMNVTKTPSTELTSV